jgi:hypothetical protein
MVEELLGVATISTDPMVKVSQLVEIVVPESAVTEPELTNQ